MIIDPLQRCISDSQKRPARFRVSYPSLRFHKERDVRLHDMLIFSVHLLALFDVIVSAAGAVSDVHSVPVI